MDSKFSKKSNKNQNFKKVLDDGVLAPLQDTQSLFVEKTANEWLKMAKLKPISKMLFSEFWHEDEICILFADTGVGKSILAVEIAESIANGEPIKGFKMEVEPQGVLLFDFELNYKQFERRYSQQNGFFNTNHFQFSNNLIRIEINPDSDIPTEDFETCLIKNIEDSIIRTKTKVLIIDNITYLRNETEKAKNALPLMQSLQNLKRKYNLSMLVLAHTPKRNGSMPITKNDLAGSKMLINFCDSSFAIGESYLEKGLRYIKQIKQRNTECIYDSENVCICSLEKVTNFLSFNFLNFGFEAEHLKQPSPTEKTELENTIREKIKQNPQITAYSIAKELCSDQEGFNSFKVKITRTYNKVKSELVT